MFEMIGKIILLKKRMPLFFILLGLGPLCAAFFLYTQQQSLQSLQETSSMALQKAKSAFRRKAKKDTFLAKHAESDPYFLDKEIESLCFLNQEKEKLKGWLAHPAVPNKEKLLRRLQFLESAENRLSFAEEEIQTSKICKETKEKQRVPIEVDAQDLKTLIHLIEEFQMNPFLDAGQHARPQLLITEFSMARKNTLLQNEVFEIKMDLLKREFNK
jgi:hypothetical protein